MTEELKPCPFCGSSRITSTVDNTAYLTNPHISVCVNCGACGANSRNVKEANIAWNTRPQDAEVERLREENKRLRALAKFGSQVLHRSASEKESPYRNAVMFLALSMDLLTAERGNFLPTELAQLPEES